MASNARYPRSATSLRINLVGLVCLSLCLLQISELGMPNRAYQVLILIVSWVAPIALLEAVFHWRDGDTLDARWSTEGPDFSGARTLQKLLSFYATLLLIALIYWILPEYSRNFFTPFWNFLRVIGPSVLIGAIPYTYYVDAYVQDPEDSNLHVGRYLLGTRRHDDRVVLTQYFLGWGVKAFFLPLMTIFASQNIGFLIGFDYSTLFANFDRFFEFTFAFVLTVDLVIAGSGYLMALRVFDAHIRSTEPTLLGWVSALLCYEPFWAMVGATYLSYDRDHFGWKNWLDAGDPIYWIWGSAILALTTIYALCTATFGLRFSNLTHRGILTNGPFRFFKHPAYVAKNLSWWLLAIPFVVDDGILNSIRECLLLLALNGIYWIRAWTEERHLSLDPVYRAYSDAVDQHGVVAWLKRVMKRVHT